MNSRTVNEVRLLLWPWCLMTLAGLVPLVRLFLTDKKSDWPEGVAVFGFFGGAAFPTALSFRNALRQFGGASLLTSRPAGTLAPPGFETEPPPPPLLSDNGISRHRIWSEKMAALAVAIACAGLIACLAQIAVGTIVWREFSVEKAIEPVLLLVIIVCSTGFWTLLARSVMGGILLTGAAQFVLYLFLVLLVTAIDRMAPASAGATRLSHEPEVHSALSWFVAGFGLSYAAVMLWLGRRRFAKMELRKRLEARR